MNTPQSTADYRKYPKGPRFLAIVLGACAFLILALAAAYFFLHSDQHVFDRGPSRTPNSLVRPLLPEATPPQVG